MNSSLVPPAPNDGVFLFALGWLWYLSIVVKDGEEDAKKAFDLQGNCKDYIPVLYGG